MTFNKPKDKINNNEEVVDRMVNGLLCDITKDVSSFKEISEINYERLLDKIGSTLNCSIGAYVTDGNNLFKLKASYYNEQILSSDIYFVQQLNLDVHTNIIDSLIDNDYIDINDESIADLVFFKELFCNKGKYNINIAPISSPKTLYGFIIYVVNNVLDKKYIDCTFTTTSNILLKNYEMFELKEENKRNIESIEKAHQIKTAFLSNISNEIRTPLNAIMGFSDLLADKDLTTDQREEFIKHITDSSKSLVRMFDNIIEASKLKANQVNYRKEWVLLSNLFLDIKNEVNFESDSVNFIIDEKKDSNKVQIYIDAFRFKQVIYNLLENAFKYTKDGYVKLSVEMDNAEIKFIVEDTGKGIAKEEIESIFKDFSNIEKSLTRESGRIGLGLSIARQIIEQMGGRIWVESVVNKGSLFYVSFPSAIVIQKNIPIKTSLKKMPDWHNYKILIAEDVEFNYIYLREILSPTGANIFWAKNGKTAIEISETENPQVILMDLQMPEMNGFEATKQIRKNNSTIPIIAQTAFAMGDEEEKCFKIGFSGFLTKPIRPKELLKTISKYLNS